MPEFLISNRASVASEKNFERMRGESYRPIGNGISSITVLTSDCCLWCATVTPAPINCAHCATKTQKKMSCTPWPWAYFTSGPNAAASIEPTLILHCSQSFFRTTCRDPGVMPGYNFLEGLLPKIWEAKKPSTIFRDFWQFSTLIANISVTDP